MYGNPCIVALIAVLLSACSLPSISQTKATSAKPAGFRPSALETKATASSEYGRLPLSFEANYGQLDSRVRYVSQGQGYSLYLTDSGAELALRAPHAASPPHAMKGDVRTVRSEVIKLELEGAKHILTPFGTIQLPGIANYLIGNDPAKWRTRIPTYANVRYERVYPGTDLVYYGKQGQLEFDFRLAPHADPNWIRMLFGGARKLKLIDNGDLLIIAENGDIAFHKPVVYQEIDGKRRSIDGRFRLMEGNRAGFVLGKYDRSREVVIDPILAYSTYLGGSGYHIPAGPDCCGESGNAIAVNRAGSAYVVGSTASPVGPRPTGFPLSPDPYQGDNPSAERNGDAFVTRFNAEGTNVIFSTYLGGSGEYRYGDSATGVAVDAVGNVYVTGTTGSNGNKPNGFPITPGAYQTSNHAYANGALNSFISKLSPDGDVLIYSSYLGGSGLGVCCSGEYLGDSASGIAVDSDGEAIVVGTAYSTDFPTVNAFQSTNKAAKIQGSNLFVSKLSADGSALLYSSYIGGTGIAGEGGDHGSGVAVDGDGNAYVVGYAYSKDYPVTTGAYQPTNNASNTTNHENGATYTNAVISKIDFDGARQIYCTYLGGTGSYYSGDFGYGIAVDASGNAYIVGQAASQDFPVVGDVLEPTAPQATTSWSGFVTKLNSDGSDLLYSTYLGGITLAGSRTGDYAAAVAVDSYGDAYITGRTTTNTFPVTSDAYQPKNNQTENGGANDYTGNAFFTELNPSGNGPIYSTFLGGSGYYYSGDVGNGIALDPDGNAYIVGTTFSRNFPATKGAFQMLNNAVAAGNPGASNAFVSKFGSVSTAVLVKTTTTVTPGKTPLAQGQTAIFTAAVEFASGSVAPTGTMDFSVDGSPLIYVPLGSDGKAEYETAGLAPGSHTVTAAYHGDVNYSSSTGSAAIIILGAPALIAPVSGYEQTATYGSMFAMPLVVVVQDSEGNPVSGAAVTFSGNRAKFSSNAAITNASGEASVTAECVAAGTVTVSAAVSGVAGSAGFPSLTCSKALLKIAANNVTVTYDAAIPKLSYTAIGFVNGDTTAVLSGSPSESTTAVKGSAPGVYPITVSQGTLAASNYGFEFVKGDLTIIPLGKAATPTFSPVAGTYSKSTSVTIKDGTAGAVIYYTTNGTTPTTASAKSTRYTGAITVSASETIKAIAVSPVYVSYSAVPSATYAIE